MSDYPMWYHKSTKFITDNGIKSFFDFENGDKVNVYNKNGELEEGTILKSNKAYYTYKINTFNVGNNDIIITNHDDKMYVANKEVITYGDDLWLSYNHNYYEKLNEGDSLAITPKNLDNIFFDLKNPELFLTGILIAVGNGYKKYYDNSNIMITKGDWFIIDRDFYNNNKNFLNWIGIYAEYYKDLPSYIPISGLTKNDLLVFIHGEPVNESFLKLEKWISCPDYYKADLFNGYMFFKNNTTDNDGRIIISETNKKKVKFIEDCCKFAGYHLLSKKFIIEPTTILNKGYKSIDHNHDENNIVEYTQKKYTKEKYSWKITLDKQYQRTNNKRFKFIRSKYVNIEDETFYYPYIIETESGSFLLNNGIIAITKPFEYIIE